MLDEKPPSMMWDSLAATIEPTKNEDLDQMA